MFHRRPNVRHYERVVAGLSRRELLNAAWKLGTAAVVLPAASTRVLTQMAFAEYPFTLGVASGDPLPTGVVLWTRLAPKPLEGGGMPMANVEVGWEMARDAAFASIVQKGAAVARPELGHAVHVEVDGLDPGRDYFYRFRVGRELSVTGRTKTAPASGASVDRLRFAVCGCSHFEAGYFTAYRRIAEERFDFVFHTGDYIYEGRDDGGRNEALARRHAGQEIYTLVDYRNRYAQYKLDADLRAAHASAPFIVTWDDHEVENDYAGDLDENDTPPEVFLLRRAAAYQAYYESMPVRHQALPSGPAARLYRRFQFGTLIDLSVLDTRQYRSNQACEHGQPFECAELRDPGRTMLGAEQERWLFDHLADVRCRWTVIGQQVPTFARDLPDASAPNGFRVDKWDGYPAARDRLFAQLVETRAPNPIVLSGDVHQHYGADLKRDFRRPESETVAVEFTNSSISSGGNGTARAANWTEIQRVNPHLRYHSNRRGYIACTATPETMRADFTVLEQVTTPGAPARIDGSLVVEAGRPGTSAA
ncbi:MAG: alkaline phosphatase D family protein [Acidobacteria bacterium]|nr:alkaline phosphatase D family protein [Acidobacteriota bacterium]